MRKEIDITISDDGRDFGKVFHIREMPASQAEKWAFRALMAVGKSGVELPDGFAQGGMKNVAILGVYAVMRMNFDDAEPLLDELMGCVSIRPSKDVIRPVIEEDIDEVATRIKLKQSVLELHTGFSFGGSLPAQTSQMPMTSPDSSNTPISQQP
ncbi:MAG TPA: hypothetical protein VHP34_11570 [Alphaproteobacteria bacterium]|nr:hypothetical protein [Alphaproteobacteria bacterium]